jgi:hypothetical protein
MGLFSRGSGSLATLPAAPVKAGGGNLPSSVIASAPVATAPPPPPRAVVPALPTERQIAFQKMKVRIHQQLVERLDVQNLRTLP